MTAVNRAVLKALNDVLLHLRSFGCGLGLVFKKDHDVSNIGSVPVLPRMGRVVLRWVE
jgi:hypothetical protein